MKNRVLGNSLVAALAMAAAGSAFAQGKTTNDVDPRYGRERGVQGQPYRWESGMGHGTKVRGNRNVKRAAVKAKNRVRHRKACRS